MSTDAPWAGALEVQTPFGRAVALTAPGVPAATLRRTVGPTEDLYRRLQLVYGIGPHTEAALRRAGYDSLLDLTRHPRWGKGAARILRALDSADLLALRQAGLRDAELLCYFADSDLAVIDIETMGLFAQPVFLIGLGVCTGCEWQIQQFLARGVEEEKALLHLVLEKVSTVSALVSYNGRAFDEPFVAARLAYHGLMRPQFLVHIDVYHECRRLVGKVLSDCRLPTVVAHLLGEERIDDLPGSEVPWRYLTYMRSGDAAALTPVLEHNRADVTGLCRLFDYLRSCRWGRAA